MHKYSGYERMFCVKCGKKTKSLLDGLCLNCLIKKDVLEIKPIKIKVCRNCGAFFHRKWKEIDLDDFLNEIVYENLAIKEGLELNIHKIESEFKYEEKELPILIRGKIGFLGDSEHSNITYKSSLNLEWRLCDRCMKIMGRRVEAVLQIRTEDKFSERDRAEIIEKVLKEVDRTSGKDRMAFISDIKELKEGVDIEFSSKKVANKIANALRKNLGGYLKESFKLIGVNKMSSKRIYKTYISLRLPKYRVDDILIAKEDLFRVISIGGDGLTLYDLINKKRVKYPWSRVEKMGLRLFENIKKCVVTAISPQKIYLLDEDYRIIELPNENDFAVGDKAKILNLKDRVILIKDES
ncbi:MAG: 60S ribosomal export protein NMD3 [Candidatus Hydrothermarchaeota archaeon]